MYNFEKKVYVWCVDYPVANGKPEKQNAYPSNFLRTEQVLFVITKICKQKKTMDLKDSEEYIWKSL